MDLAILIGLGLAIVFNMVLLATVSVLVERVTMGSQELSVIQGQLVQVKALIGKLAVDLQTLADRLLEPAITKDEATAVANELGGIISSLQALDAQTPDPVSPTDPTEPTEPTDPVEDPETPPTGDGSTDPDSDVPPVGDGGTDPDTDPA